MEQIMTDIAVRNPPAQSPGRPAVADVMRRPLATVDQNDHVAAAAYLMSHAQATALLVVDARTNQTVGIITEADVAHTVADGEDVNEVRVHTAMTTRPAVADTTSIRDAGVTMTSGKFRHLPVVGQAGLLGIIDINDVCRVLIGADEE
jgi:CBS domain-containing protein